MDLATVEALCQKIYGQHATPEERKSAHHELLFLQTSASYVDQCLMILSQSKDLPTLMFACQSLNLVFKRDWQNISPQTRLTLQQFLIEMIANHAAAFDTRHFLTRKLIQTMCNLTRRAWCDDVRMHGVVDYCLFWMSNKKTDLALRVMGDLVNEFDQAKSQSYFGEDSSRRAFQSFRELEGGLFRILTTSVDIVWASAQLLPHSQQVLCESLRCLLACLSFDFSGTGGADADAINFSGALITTTVYLPKAWIPLVGSEKSITDFFLLYQEQFKDRESAFGEEIASLILQCLTLIAGIRRTTSTTMMTQSEAGRNAHLYAMLRGVEQLCKTRLGFADSEDCLHHFCRLLGRVRITPQQLLADPDLSFYYEHTWLPTAREFSMNCLQAWLTVSPHSIGYLFDFWKAMSNQLETAKKCNLLRPLVFTYLQSRLEMCEVAAIGMSGSRQMRDALRVARETRLASDLATAACDLDEIDPLKCEETLLDEIASICSFVSGDGQGQEKLLLEGIATALSTGSDLEKGTQAKRAFCMYFVGCLISVRGNNGDDVEQQLLQQQQDLSAELALCASAFKTMCEMTLAGAGASGEDQLAAQRSVKYEQAILYFLQCFHYMLLESKTRSQIAAMEYKQQQQTRRYMRLSTSMPPPASHNDSSSSDDMPGLTSLAHHRAVGAMGSALDDSYIKSGRGSYLRPLTIKRTSSSGGFDDILESRVQSPLEEDSMGGSGTASQDMLPFQDQLTNEYVKSHTVSRRIGELIGVPGDEMALLNIAVQHLFNVLMQLRRNREEETLLVERALSVLKHLLQSSSVVVTSMSAIPKMVKSGSLFLDLEFIQGLLRNATPNIFPLLNATGVHGRARSRTAYMAILSFLFFLQLDSLPPPATVTVGISTSMAQQSERLDDAFVQFMHPLSQQQQALNAEFFLRDVRGVFQSASEFSQYELCFAWLFLPERLSVLRECANLGDAAVSVALLKLLVEVASNRDARIAFPASSLGPSLLVSEFVSIALPLCTRLWEEVQTELRKQESKFIDLWNANNVARDLHGSNTMNMASLHAMVEEMSHEEEDVGGKPRGALPIRFKQVVVGMGFTLEHAAPLMKQISQACLLLTRLSKICPSVQFRELQALVLNLALSCDPAHLSSYAKCEQNFITFCYHLSETAPTLLLGLSPSAFARLMAVLGLALQQAKPAAAASGILSTHAAYTVETIAAMRSRAFLFSLTHNTQQQAGGEGADSNTYYCLRANQGGFVKSELSMQHRIHKQSKVYLGRELRQCIQVFGIYESQEPHLFADLFQLLLERVLTVSEQELTNLYALTRPLLALACTNQAAVSAFTAYFVQTQSMARQRAMAEQLGPIIRILTLADANSPTEVCDFLRRQDEFTKDLCKTIRRFRDYYFNSA